MTNLISQTFKDDKKKLVTFVTGGDPDLKTSLKKQINNLNSSSDLRNKLSKNIKKLAKVNATTLIADEIKNILSQDKLNQYIRIQAPLMDLC